MLKLRLPAAGTATGTLRLRLIRCALWRSTAVLLGLCRSASLMAWGRAALLFCGRSAAQLLSQDAVGPVWPGILVTAAAAEVDYYVV